MTEGLSLSHVSITVSPKRRMAVTVSTIMKHVTAVAISDEIDLPRITGGGDGTSLTCKSGGDGVSGTIVASYVRGGSGFISCFLSPVGDVERRRRRGIVLYGCIRYNTQTHQPRNTSNTQIFSQTNPPLLKYVVYYPHSSKMS